MNSFFITNAEGQPLTPELPNVAAVVTAAEDFDLATDQVRGQDPNGMSVPLWHFVELVLHEGTRIPADVPIAYFEYRA